MPAIIRKLIYRLCGHDPATMFLNAPSYSARQEMVANFKKKHPVKGFLLYTLDEWNYARADWWWNYIHEPCVNFIRRFISRQHLTNNGTLPGDSLDVNNAILHTAFNVLVDFVEREIPRGWAAGCNYEQLKAHGYAKWQTRGLARSVLWHKPEFGITLLERFMDDSHLEQETRIIYDLYIWWTVVRPLRPEPYEASGNRALYDRFNEKYGLDWTIRNLTPEENKLWDDLDEKERSVWQSYTDEDTMMLQRLIDHRDKIYF